MDDPHSEQDVINGNFGVFEKAYEWFTFGARTRLMPGGRVAIIQTRWHLDDLTGRVVRDMGKNERADQYNVVEFPAILDIEDKKTKKMVQKPLWPEFFDLEASTTHQSVNACVPVELTVSTETHYRRGRYGQAGVVEQVDTRLTTSV